MPPQLSIVNYSQRIPPSSLPRLRNQPIKHINKSNKNIQKLRMYYISNGLERELNTLDYYVLISEFLKANRQEANLI